MEYLKNVKFVTSVFQKDKLIQNDLPIIAIVGKSNVGKSSFINSLANNKSLAKVGNNPGKTRSVNYYLVDNSFYIVDLPGYGYSKMSDTERKKVNNLTNYFLENTKNICQIFSLMDIRHIPTGEDKAMYNWLALSNIPFTILLNKADKLSNLKIEEMVKSVTKFLFAKEEIIPYSAEKKLNVDKVLDIIKKVI